MSHLMNEGSEQPVIKSSAEKLIDNDTIVDNVTKDQKFNDEILEKVRMQISNAKPSSLLTRGNVRKMPEVIEQQKASAKPPVMPKKYGHPRFKKPPQLDKQQAEIDVKPEKIQHEIRKLK